MKKIIALLLSAAMVLGCLPALAENTKHERVYVTAAADGTVKSITDSVRLENTDGLDEILDRTLLTGIRNAGGDESFTLTGEDLTWQANGKDIIYQGTSDKMPAILPAVKLTLDGSEVSFTDLKDRTGDAVLTVTYPQTEKLPALAVTVLYLFLGRDGGAPVAAEAVKPLLILPYLLVIVLAVCGMDVLAVLVTGTVANALIGILGGSVGWIGFLKACGDGIASMGELIIVTMLAGGLLELIRQDGGLEWMIRGLTRRITGKRGAELSIAALVSLVNVCTANNTIAIITSGALAKEITERFGLDPRKTASILDTFSCLVQGILPYGAQMLMASGLAGIAATAIIPHLYYPFALGAVALLAILLRLPRKYS
jgi:hypothetical protein